MGLIPETVIDEVLARADIVQTVRDYVSLKKSGVNYKGLCPFHDENTPSFFVHPGKRIFKCFGCGVGGNVISFLMEIEGLSFPEAVRQLADRNGVQIPDEDPEQAERARKRRRGKKLYYQIMDLARDFYEENLWSEQGAAARHYLEERAIDRKTAEKFGLGYAPRGWQNLLDHLEGEQIEPRLVERAGLALSRNNSAGHYDRFRHRVVFPVVDVWDNTLGFGGRVIAADDDAPKYINSPETRFYTKGEHLYGLNVAKQAIQKEGRALLVEGNFDVISLHAQGLETAVAPMGTSLTTEQARLLARYCDRVVIAFDGDRAGERATRRCLRSLSQTNLEALVIRFDELEDPDTFVRRYGAGALVEKIEQARPLVGWALDRILAPAQKESPQKQVRALEESVELLKEISNRVVQKRAAEEIARRLSLDQALVEQYIRYPSKARERVYEVVGASSELERSEYELLMVFLDHPEWLESFFQEDLQNLLVTREFVDLLELLLDEYRSEEEFQPALFLEKIENRALRGTVAQALTDDQNYNPDKAARHYRGCVRTLKRKWAERTLDDLTRQIDQVDFYEERETFEQLCRRKEEIARFRASLDVE